ncbi:CD160 antigen isoform X2 [Trichosurus vulpecula]|uniref:CD160 antigen isoform X2 n=1 Tax=Trichosurus vulpecula TaxID=9337 RepID=UPI00186B24B8|nr:CD160 antigen isoform X2 [Trichosurus vulpecula]
MATGLRCFLMVVLIAAVEIKRAGCMDIFSSREPVFLQEGEKLSLNCTLSYKNEEAKGLTMFWCKNRITQGCSPGTSLQQLKLKREVGVGEIAPLRKRYTSIVLTILQAKPTDSGIYQCCARSQNPNTLFQSHYIPVTITEKGNYTTTESKYQGDALSNHSEKSFKMSSLKEKIWGLMVIGLLALKGL